jgi:hypothetical protein
MSYEQIDPLDKYFNFNPALDFNTIDSNDTKRNAHPSCETGQFTTKCQFNDVSVNYVPNTNQKSCIQTFQNQHCPQGFQEDNVMGFE